MKLALVTQDFPPETGGIQTYCWELARRFHASVERFTVITCTPPSSDHQSFDRSQPFRVVRCPGRSDLLPLSLARVLPGLVRTGEVDTVLHAQWQTLPVSTYLHRTNKLKAVFCAAHGRELLLQPVTVPGIRAAYETFRRTLLSATQGLFPVSRFTRGLLVKDGIPEQKCVVVSNGTDPEHFRPTDATALRCELGLDGAFVILYAGRLKRNKGLDTAIAGLKQVCATYPNAVLVVVGEGDDKPRLQTLIEQEGLQSSVRFVGKVAYSELPAYYSMADVFVTLSREEPPAVEGFGLVFLEAGACETAVIGAESGGIPDAVVDEETGLLVPPNDPSAFAQAALRLLHDPDLRRMLGTNARKRVLRQGTWARSHDVLLREMNIRRPA